MKILHLSTGDNRGAFSGAYRLHRNLIEKSLDSFMYVGQKTVSDTTVLAPSKLFQGIRFALEKSSSILAKILFGVDVQLSRIFKFNIGFVPTYEILKTINRVKPDIIIVYYVADFMSEKQLLAIKRASNAKMIFYLMDMGMLTGSCHYAWDCMQYRTGCVDCPMTSVPTVKKIIKHKWASRSKAYGAINPMVLAGSEQLSEQSGLSGLTKSLDIRKLLIGINQRVFTPASRTSAREHFGFADKQLVIYFGAQNIEDKRKGFKYLVGALRILRNNLSEDERSKIILFTVGSGDPLIQHDLNFEHVHVSFIADKTLFGQTYAAADVFVCPSIEDSGPMMVNESMMSGTPVIAFDVGVAKDLVVDGVTGYKVENKQEEALASAIQQFISLSQQQISKMRVASRKHAIELCSAEVQVDSVIKFGNELLQNRVVDLK